MGPNSGKCVIVCQNGLMTVMTANGSFKAKQCPNYQVAGVGVSLQVTRKALGLCA